MKEYEITYLVDPKIDEKAINNLDEKINGVINGLEGEISYNSPNDAPGSRRRLIFPIQGQRVAWMKAVQLQLDPSKIEDLKNEIKKTEHVLRVTVLQTPRREEVSAQIFESAEKEAAAAKVPAEEIKKSTKKVTMAEVEEKIEEALEEEVK